MARIGLAELVRNVQVLVAASPLYRAFCGVENADDLWDDIEEIVSTLTPETALTEEQERTLDVKFSALRIFQAIALDDADGEQPPRAIVYVTDQFVAKKISQREWVGSGAIGVCLEKARNESLSRLNDIRRFTRAVQPIHDEMLHLSDTNFLIELERSSIEEPPNLYETDDEGFLRFTFLVEPPGWTV